MAQPFFSIRMTNIRDVKGVFRNMADKGAAKHARDLARESGRVVVGALKEEAPVGKHYTFKGQLIQPAERLRDAFFYRTFVRGKAVLTKVYVKPKQKDKLGWVILGTRPHKRGRRIIRPKTKKALAFYWARKKKSMVLPYVQHPGSLPNPFHERALRKAQPRLDKLERRAARNITEEMAHRWPKGTVEVI